MRLAFGLLIGGLPLAFAGTFHIFDVEGTCRIYSINNRGCTGVSEPVGNLIGRDCYRKKWALRFYRGCC